MTTGRVMLTVIFILAALLPLAVLWMRRRRNNYRWMIVRISDGAVFYQYPYSEFHTAFARYVRLNRDLPTALFRLTNTNPNVRL